MLQGKAASWSVSVILGNPSPAPSMRRPLVFATETPKIDAHVGANWHKWPETCIRIQKRRFLHRSC